MPTYDYLCPSNGRVVAYFKVVGDLNGLDQTRAVYRWTRGPARRGPGRR